MDAHIDRYIYGYPIAFGLPATVPTQGDWFINVFLNLFVICFFRFCCSGDRFYTILVSFWCRFGDILVSFWCPWGSFGDPGAPRAPLKGQRRKSDEKVGSLAAFWLPLGVPLGSNFRYFCVFSVFFLAIFSKRFLEGFWGLRGPPPTMKIMVSSRRNHNFHISPLPPK